MQVSILKHLCQTVYNYYYCKLGDGSDGDLLLQGSVIQ
jgi:hypothetical protein